MPICTFPVWRLFIPLLLLLWFCWVIRLQGGLRSRYEGVHEGSAERWNIVVFGATGQTGRHAVEQLLAQGHKVTWVVRRPDQLTLRHDGLRVVKGDVFDSDSFHPVLEGKDAVVSVLGV